MKDGKETTVRKFGATIPAGEVTVYIPTHLTKRDYNLLINGIGKFCKYLKKEKGQNFK
jgi:hypothetical protein